MTKRENGSGTIEPHHGAFRVRVRVQKQRSTLGTYATREEAESALRGWLALRADGAVPRGGKTLEQYAVAWLDSREAQGNRDEDNDRNRWAAHVASTRLAALPIETIGRRDVRAWLDALRAKKSKKTGRKLSPQTIKHCLNLVRSCLQRAVDDELVDRNPAAGLVVHKAASADPGWTYLTPEEQAALLTCPKIARSERLLVAFAIGTGLRQGEQWALELRDLHLDDDAPHVFVRWGSPGLPPKNGKTRRVPLMGIALAAAKEWIAGLPRYLTSPSGKKTYENTYGLAFPTLRGHRRRENKAPRGWATWLEDAGLVAAERHDRRGVRWHDLRHTCASSLVAGWWGRAWRLDEARDVLGHSSVTVTERYAHLAPSVLATAAAATPGPQLAPKPPPPAIENAEIPGRATLDSNQWPSAPEAHHKIWICVDLDAIRGHVGATEDAGRAYLAAITSRSRFAHRQGVEHVEAAAGLCSAVKAAVVEAESGEGAGPAALDGGARNGA